MEQLLTFLAQEITGAPNVNVAQEEKDGVVTFTITLPKEFVGQLIGKDGRVVSSIRTLAAVRAAKENVRVGIEVKEE
ncbi:KH domain-containing protein [Candidatus Microgenomates bacterium]|nr:KH domain-containing protein [Candidatus Microgenomates bacterium]